MTSQEAFPGPRDRIFSDTLLNVRDGQRLCRASTTITSFALECLIIAALLVVPLLRTVRMPVVQRIASPISLGHRVIRQVGDVVHPALLSRTTDMPLVPFVQPGRIPHSIPIGNNDSFDNVPNEPSSCIGCAPSGTPEGVPDIFVGGNAAVVPIPLPPKPVVRQFRTSRVLAGNLIRQVQPLYPALARSARIQGAVLLSAVIGKDGAIENLRVLSGHPMLVAAAIEAVRQWRYRPYVLNGDAIEVETQITVNFMLEGR